MHMRMQLEAGKLQRHAAGSQPRSQARLQPTLQPTLQFALCPPCSRPAATLCSRPAPPQEADELAEAAEEVLVAGARQGARQRQLDTSLLRYTYYGFTYYGDA